MQDIARIARVSQATVSRTLHSPEIVKPATRERVLRAIEKTGYVYDSAAADFRLQRNSLVGLIVFTARSSIQAEMIEGIQEELANTRYSLVIGDSGYDPMTERRLIRTFQQRQLAGLIVAGSTDDNRDLLHAVHNGGIPTVITWELSDDLSLDCVGFDNFAAAKEITKYLLSLGHRRIGLIAGRFDRIRRVRQRYQGYRAALSEAKVPFDESLVIAKNPTAMDGKVAMSQLILARPRPTAVFAASDALALGALGAAREANLRVPEDISVCGFDDTDFAPFCVPPLTTVRVPTYEMGRRAARTILDHADGGVRQPLTIELRTEMIVRDSCCPPSGDIKSSVLHGSRIASG